MESPTLVPVEEYLETQYQDGDREYVDGRIVERNVGEIARASQRSSSRVRCGSEKTNVSRTRPQRPPKTGTKISSGAGTTPDSPTPA
jgi:hypothetical protein